MDAFAEADSRSTDEQECMGVEIIGMEQFLLQELILLRGKWSRKIARFWREVFLTNEIGLNGVAVGSEIVQQPAELKKVTDASFVALGWLPFSQPAEPAEQMGIAAQLGDLAKLWEGGAEIRQKSARHVSIVVYRAGPKGKGERPNLCFEDQLQVGAALGHERWEESNALRFSMARVYSRQTSCGASSTYSMVVAICEWPISRCRAGRDIPARTISAPNVCRHRWGLAWWTWLRTRWCRNSARSPTALIGWPRCRPFKQTKKAPALVSGRSRSR